MAFGRRRIRQISTLVAGFFILIHATWYLAPYANNTEFRRLERFMNGYPPVRPVFVKSSFDWGKVPLRFLSNTPSGTKSLPKQRRPDFPGIQYEFGLEPESVAVVRRARRAAVRAVAKRDWQHYRARAWKMDSLGPLSGTGKNQLSGWSTTLVDSLDTLWIMGLKAEFYEAVSAVASIDFGKSTSDRVNIFETNIRYLGGLLSAYDLSRQEVLLAKAVELGDMLYAGFNTENGMPVDFISFAQSKTGMGLSVEPWVVSAAPGSLSMEMTRLSQITGNMKYYDVVSAVMDLFRAQQNETRLPGLWPIWVSMREMDVRGREGFTVGGGADSSHEYLAKMMALLGGWEPRYEAMTRFFMQTADKELFFRPMVPGGEDILISGSMHVDERGFKTFGPESEHLACFVGGAMALGGRLLRQQGDVTTGAKLARGCAYVYGAFPTGIMPERFNMVPCDPPRAEVCAWNQSRFDEACDEHPEWQPHLPPGFTTAKDARYLLRPEAIESVFVSYRITGDAELQTTAWTMFEAVAKGSYAEFGHASILDVTRAAEELPREDYMESFWFAETLKYFYLVFSPPDVISLDEFVLNTEAHPFRMPGVGRGQDAIVWDQ